MCVCAQGAEGEEQTREKRKLEGVTQAKFGIKNAVLGFVFGVSSYAEIHLQRFMRLMQTT